MPYKLQVSKYTSIKQLVYSCLIKLLSIDTYQFENEGIKNEKIHLHKDRDKNVIIYTSSVSLRLSKSQNRKAMELASAIASDISGICGDVFSIQIVPPGLIYFELTHSTLAAWLQNLVIGSLGKVGEAGEAGKDEDKANNQCPMPKTSLREAAPTAYLGYFDFAQLLERLRQRLPRGQAQYKFARHKSQFDCAHRKLSTSAQCPRLLYERLRQRLTSATSTSPNSWRGCANDYAQLLERLRQRLPRGQAQDKLRTSSVQVPNLFAVQYAHARCCSLVLLAHREGLIKLKEPVPNTNPAFWSIISPDPLPWLNCDGTLRLNHPDERRLIGELIQVVDNIYCPDVKSSVKWEKVALSLSQAFEKFWCNCRIWGEVKITSPELAQARLGLLMATQSVLRFVLEENLGVFAPLEL